MIIQKKRSEVENQHGVHSMIANVMVVEIVIYPILI
jgi:hypothetical protein